MSAMRWVPLWVNKHTLPPVPTPTMTRLGVVAPATRLRLDTVGRATPQGQTVTNPLALASVPVTLSTTAAASAGTWLVPVPVTFSSTTPPTPGFGPVYPVAASGRVSSNRSGTSDVNDAPAGK